MRLLLVRGVQFKWRNCLGGVRPGVHGLLGDGLGHRLPTRVGGPFDGGQEYGEAGKADHLFPTHFDMHDHQAAPNIEHMIGDGRALVN
ncbi:hypothetical protein GGD83_001588 [Rhodoblastus sphagnicola]|uniref:hypothetical protein n=1 Tax=Rhodoblastus sphagnicola TaxID=333368 RepID=UPI0011AFFE97|nr:hypothetical protein [Rhodoblastus sphagnicola]MBB4197796.1 hypothetical protein [Rhodoblastus sphagnicola]